MRGYGIAIAASLIACSNGGRATGGCKTYPEGVPTGYSDCVLRDAGERPLWHGHLQSGVVQAVRFTFTEGHLAYTKIVDIVQRVDGKASVRLTVLRRDHDRYVVSLRQRRLLSAHDWTMVDQLGSSSGAWEHRIASWDGNEIYIHCEMLDMERATAEGYSFASVSISCNQPQRLMPLASFVTGLVGLKPYADRQMF